MGIKIKFGSGSEFTEFMLSTVVAHTLLNTARTVGCDCSYNPGWCRSHSTVSEMT